MALFKNRDRAKRQSRRALHASAMNAARVHYSFSDPEDGEDFNLQDAWTEYSTQMFSFGTEPVSYETFKKEFQKT